jgi:hypothetical protein
MQVSELPGAATALARALTALPDTVHGYVQVNGTPTNTDTEVRGHTFGCFASPAPQTATLDIAELERERARTFAVS